MEDAASVNVYVVFCEEGPPYDAVSQMSAEAWGYNVEPPPLPNFLLENAVALLRRPKGPEAINNFGDLHNLENEDPTIHQGLLVRFLRFSPYNDRIGMMLDLFQRNLVADASGGELMSLGILKRRGCGVVRSLLDPKVALRGRKRPWAGSGRYRYLLPVVFPEDRDVIEALVGSIQSHNERNAPENSIRVYAAQVIWNLAAAVTIQTAWRAYRVRKAARRAMLSDLLLMRASHFIRNWIWWQLFKKKMVLCKALRDVCEFRSRDGDVFLTHSIRTEIETYMRHQPPRMIREQYLQFTVDNAGCVVIVASSRYPRQGLPVWPGCTVPIKTPEECAAEGLPPAFPMGDISPLLLQGGNLTDVAYLPGRPRPEGGPEVRIAFASPQEATNRICLMLAMTWNVHLMKGIRLLQIPFTVRLLMQTAEPDQQSAKMIRLTEMLHSEEDRIKGFVQRHYGNSAIRPFLEDLLLASARASLREAELAAYDGKPGPVIGIEELVPDTVRYHVRQEFIRAVPMLMDTVRLSRQADTAAQASAPTVPQPRRDETAWLSEGVSTLNVSAGPAPSRLPIGSQIALAAPSARPVAPELRAEGSVRVEPGEAPMENRPPGYGPKAAAEEVLSMKKDVAEDIRSLRGMWEQERGARQQEFYDEKRAIRDAIRSAPPLPPRSLDTAFLKAPQGLGDIWPTSDNADLVRELGKMYTESARIVVDRERAAHEARMKELRETMREKMQALHDAREDRRQRAELGIAMARAIEVSTRATQVQATKDMHKLQRHKARARTGDMDVVRRLASVGALLVKQRRLQEKEHHLEDVGQIVQARRKIADQWNHSVHAIKEERKLTQRARREEEGGRNERAIEDLKARSTLQKKVLAGSVREEETLRRALVPPAGGVAGRSVARNLHVGKRLAPLSTVMGAAEVARLREPDPVTHEILSSDLRGWSSQAAERPTAFPRPSSTGIMGAMRAEGDAAVWVGKPA